MGIEIAHTAHECKKDRLADSLGADACEILRRIVMRKLILSAVGILMLQALPAMAQQAPFKLYSARLIVTKDLTSGDTSSFNFGKALWNGRNNFWSEVKKYEAEINIQELRPDDLTMRTTIIPVTVSFKYTGVLLKTEFTTGIMGIHDLKGKKIGDILGRYVGGQGGLAAIANFDEMYVKNAAGVSVNDVQTIWAGVGLSGTKVDMVISARDTQDTKTTTQAPNSQAQQTATNIDDLLQTQLQ